MLCDDLEGRDRWDGGTGRRECVCVCVCVCVYIYDLCIYVFICVYMCIHMFLRDMLLLLSRFSRVRLCVTP